MDKRCPTAAEAVADVAAGSRIAVGGFGLVGIPATLIKSLVDRPDVRDLEIVSNNCGVDNWGLGLLLAAGRIRRIVASYVGENKEFARQYLAGELEVELTPQGTLAERLRAGGSGIAAFYTRTGVGTQVAEGGLPWRYDGAGGIAVASPTKPLAVFDEQEFVLERALTTDVALIRAWRGDRHGNLVFRRSARNFNPLCARAAALTIAEVEEFVEPGELDPDAIHLPGIYVDRVVALDPDAAADKRIEKRTVTEGSR
ncbi:CoA transferase subunit A [Streptomyces chartreusis]|uniref:CoA transferase subunit A n=1 Tax=Streptomyces chartreusis TaxID=1969 RepID=UPI00369A7F7D